MTRPNNRFEKFEVALCLSSVIFFSCLIILGIKFTHVPLGNTQKLVESLNSSLPKNNHAIVSLQFLYMDSDRISNFRNDLAERLRTLSLMESVADYRIRNIFLHSLANYENIAILENNLIAPWDEPEDTFQKSFSLYVILTSKNGGNVVDKWRDKIHDIQTNSKNDDVKLLAELILDKRNNIQK